METKNNRLKTLLGDYMSDSDNEDTPSSKKSTQQNSDKGLNGTHSNNNEVLPKQHPVTTSWTECIDQNTGHPYYWNTESKEVTWEKPAEYVKYLNSMKSIYSPLPEDCWVIGYSDDSQVPYYVNEITRVVSWEKPANFKDPSLLLQEPGSQNTTNPMVQAVKQNKFTNETDKKTKSNRKRSKKPPNKPLPKHLQSTSSDDEKIEVISEYVEPKETSSDEEDGSQNKKVKIETTQSQKSLHLVAAYATDSDSEAGNDLSTKKTGTDKTVEQSMPLIVPKQQESIVPPLNINAKSFASIITGGKTGDVDMDEELNKFKEELEKDLQNVVNAEDPQEMPEQPKEQSFDEKTFQRKRRIEFNVKPSKPRKEESLQKVEPDHDTNDSNSERASIKTKPQFISFHKSHVEFESKPSPEPVVYGPEPLSPETVKKEQVLKTNKSDHSVEINDLCDIISDKVKFLSVGKPEVSAVQIMSIQLEALHSAFRASCLDSEYFFKWLKATSDDLQMLEQNAAPEGWECKWDRDSSQYCYKNRETNEIRWEFPYESGTTVQQEQAGIAEDNNKDENKAEDLGDEDDDAMDICTTPPPPPSPPIISGGCYQWDPGNAVQTPECARPADISGELASFYSDIASIDPSASNLLDNEPSGLNINSNVPTSTNDDSSPSSKKMKKRKKVKVPGLGSKMQEVSSMVANWQKAQKELGN